MSLNYNIFVICWLSLPFPWRFAPICFPFCLASIRQNWTPARPPTQHTPPHPHNQVALQSHFGTLIYCRGSHSGDHYIDCPWRSHSSWPSVERNKRLLVTALSTGYWYVHVFPKKGREDVDWGTIPSNILWAMCKSRRLMSILTFFRYGLNECLAVTHSLSTGNAIGISQQETVHGTITRTILTKQPHANQIMMTSISAICWNERTVSTDSLSKC